jgi:hypothetical protein
MAWQTLPTTPFSPVLVMVPRFPTVPRTTARTREIFTTPTFFTQSQRRRHTWWRICPRSEGATDFIRTDSISRNRAWICGQRSCKGATNFIWTDSISRNASTAIRTTDYPSGFDTAKIDEIEIDCL